VTLNARRIATQQEEGSMKFTPWQLVAVIAILLAAVIVANIYAPGAAATVVSMATTIFGALFVNRIDGGDGGGPPSGSPPALRVLDGGATDRNGASRPS
jgi:hypothetical protein